MKLNKWRLKDKVYEFPQDWDKNKVLSFANTDIKVCPICFKVDVGLDHFPKCNTTAEAERQNRITDYYN